MGQKTNPKALRLGITQDWDSTWYDFYNYSDKVLEDFNIRNFLKTELSRAGVSLIKIRRKSDQLEINIVCARPGIIFGKTGINLDIVNEELRKKIKKNNVVINIIENKSPDATAALIATWICGQIEKRIPFRRAMKSAIQKCLKSGVNGVKISCSGRLAGIEIARCEWYKEGKIPLHTLRAKIDYSFNEALTTYGKIGVKVWLYKGDIISKDKSKGLQEDNVKS
ncbi:30S ribosomal protein S3 [Candidatus Marinamargulisbacteria bacterium SCGC AG-333-B06]|nr:30S ribosomal protein S3 [Candidatus Marinamargulisbacteria bacterium SCGC AG-333-B06]